MKRFFKIVGILVVVALLCVAGFIGLVEFLHWRAERDLDKTVLALPPGTPFARATERLGSPQQIVTDPSAIPSFRRFSMRSGMRCSIP